MFSVERESLVDYELEVDNGKLTVVANLKGWRFEFYCSLFLLLFRKKTKTAPSVIQISSKSRLSSWSKPNFQLRSKSAIGHSSSDLSFSSLHRSKLGALPTSFSDSCLAKRRLDDTDEFKNPSASAPQSFSGSSSSSGSEDEDDTSGETEDMDHYDPSVMLVRLFQHV